MKVSSATAASHRERLALRLLQNWTAKHPTDSCGATSSTPGAAGSQPQRDASPAVVDDSLTSLAWLQNLNVMKLASGSSSSLSNASARASSTSGGHVTGNRPTGAVQPMQLQQQQQGKSLPRHVHVNPNAILDMTGGRRAASGGGTTRVKSEPASPDSGGSSPPLPPPRLSPPPPPRCADSGGSSPPLPALQRTDTSNSTSTKPKHSYATLICMAMNEAPDRRVTLNNIYSWIVENFPYFRTADPSWQVCCTVIFHFMLITRIAMGSMA